jgi:TPR repeat protein
MVVRDACNRQYAPACGSLAKQLYKAGPNGGSAGQARELAKRGCEGHDLTSCSLLISLARGEADQLGAAENFLLARCNGIVPEACVALGRGYAAQAIPQGDRGLMNGLFTRGCEQRVADGCAELAVSHQFGRGTPVRLEEALRQAALACAQGSDRGCVSKADLLIATAADDAFAQAEPIYREACLHDDPRGCAGEARLTMLRDKGRLSPELLARLTLSCNTEPAACEQLFSWTARQAKPTRAPLEKACAEGEPHACRFLAASLMERSHGPTDPQEAAMLRSASCDRHDPESCVDLAVQRITGPGLQPNPSEARVALTALCKADTLRACVELGLLIGQPGASLADRTEAHTVLDHACLQGAGWGCVHLGRRETTDIAQALAWLDRGCSLQVGWGCVEAGDLRTAKVASEAGRAITDYLRGCEAGTMQGCLKAAQSLNRINPGDAQAKALAQLACDGGLPEACPLCATPKAKP